MKHHTIEITHTHSLSHTHTHTQSHTHTGTWAEQAMGNLQKIIKAVSTHEETSEEGGPARKRVCVRVCESNNIATSLCILSMPSQYRN